MKKIALIVTSAVLALGLVACGNATTTEQGTTYRDGSYRGAFIDGSIQVELSLKENKVEEIKFRKLEYKGEDYLKSEDEVLVGLKGQYESLLTHLVGKDIASVEDLYTPGEIAEDIDGLSGSTIRSGKVISAINDALNRGVYSLPKAE